MSLLSAHLKIKKENMKKTFGSFLISGQSSAYTSNCNLNLKSSMNFTVRTLACSQEAVHGVSRGSPPQSATPRRFDIFLFQTLDHTSIIKFLYWRLLIHPRLISIIDTQTIKPLFSLSKPILTNRISTTRLSLQGPH